MKSKKKGRRSISQDQQQTGAVQEFAGAGSAAAAAAVLPTQNDISASQLAQLQQYSGDPRQSISSINNRSNQSGGAANGANFSPVIAQTASGGGRSRASSAAQPQQAAFLLAQQQQQQQQNMTGAQYDVRSYQQQPLPQQQQFYAAGGRSAAQQAAPQQQQPRSQPQHVQGMFHSGSQQSFDGYDSDEFDGVPDIGSEYYSTGSDAELQEAQDQRLREVLQRQAASVQYGDEARNGLPQQQYYQQNNMIPQGYAMQPQQQPQQQQTSRSRRHRRGKQSYGRRRTISGPSDENMSYDGGSDQAAPPSSSAYASYSGVVPIHQHHNGGGGGAAAASSSTSVAPLPQQQQRMQRTNTGRYQQQQNQNQLITSPRRTISWMKLATHGKPPVPRGFHSCTFVDVENKIYIIGGDARQKYFQDVHTYDVASETWQELPPESRLRSPITGHTCTFYAGVIFLFGGKNGSGNYLSDLWMFNLTTRRWELLQQDRRNRVLPRGAHSSVVIGNKWYIFGGVTQQNLTPTRVTQYVAPGGARATGKEDDTLQYLNSLVVFDLDNRTWSTPRVTGNVPDARAGHSAVAVGNMMYIFGGRKGTLLLQDVYGLNTSTLEWKKIKTGGDMPQTRGGHTMNVISDHMLLLFGGTDWNAFFQDIFVLDLRDNKWIKFLPQGDVPSGRFWHTSVVINTRMFMFGGGNMKEGCMNDMHVLDLRPVLALDALPAIPALPAPSASAAPAILPPAASVPALPAPARSLVPGGSNALVSATSSVVSAAAAAGSSAVSTESAPQSAPDLLTIKIKEYLGEFRVFKFPRDYPFIFQRLNEMFHVFDKTSGLILRYQDHEGDFITIRTEEELKWGVEYFEKEKLTIKFLVVPNSEKDTATSTPTPPTPLTPAVVPSPATAPSQSSAIPAQSPRQPSPAATPAATPRRPSNTQVNQAVGPNDTLGSGAQASTNQPISYQVLDDTPIGEGAYGKVYKILEISTGRQLALKEIDLRGGDEKSKARGLKDVANEIRLMSQLKHKNIVQYIGAETTRDKNDRQVEKLRIFLEYCAGGSLHNVIQKVTRLHENTVRSYTRQILMGLKYLHDHKIIHRDLKSSNILLTTDGVVKLADFGHSKLDLGQGQDSVTRGTPMWMAPETMQPGYLANKASDIWSLGCTILEMFTGTFPWPNLIGLPAVAIIFHIATKEVTPPIPEYISDDAREFLSRCLQRDPEQRATVEELLEHPFVTRLLDDASRLQSYAGAASSSGDGAGPANPQPQVEEYSSSEEEEEQGGEGEDDDSSYTGSGSEDDDASTASSSTYGSEYQNSYPPPSRVPQQPVSLNQQQQQASMRGANVAPATGAPSAASVALARTGLYPQRQPPHHYLPNVPSERNLQEYHPFSRDQQPHHLAAVRHQQYGQQHHRSVESDLTSPRSSGPDMNSYGSDSEEYSDDDDYYDSGYYSQTTDRSSVRGEEDDYSGSDSSNEEVEDFDDGQAQQETMRSMANLQAQFGRGGSGSASSTVPVATPRVAAAPHGGLTVSTSAQSRPSSYGQYRSPNSPAAASAAAAAPTIVQGGQLAQGQRRPSISTPQSLLSPSSVTTTSSTSSSPMTSPMQPQPMLPYSGLSRRTQQDDIALNTSNINPALLAQFKKKQQSKQTTQLGAAYSQAVPANRRQSQSPIAPYSQQGFGAPLVSPGSQSPQYAQQQGQPSRVIGRSDSDMLQVLQQQHRNSVSTPSPRPQVAQQQPVLQQQQQAQQQQAQPGRPPINFSLANAYQAAQTNNQQNQPQIRQRIAQRAAQPQPQVQPRPHQQAQPQLQRQSQRPLSSLSQQQLYQLAQEELQRQQMRQQQQQQQSVSSPTGSDVSTSSDEYGEEHP